MEQSAAGLLSEAHGSALRLLGTAVIGDFDGLSTMARAALKRGLISSKLKKRLEYLDIAVAFNRHAHEGKVRRLQHWLQAELSGSLASSGSDGDSDGARIDVIDVGGPPQPLGQLLLAGQGWCNRGPQGLWFPPPMPPAPPVWFVRKRAKAGAAASPRWGQRGRLVPSMTCIRGRLCRQG